MEIERLNITLVPRRVWAALDMGFVLGRAWFRRLWFAWAIVAVPVFLISLTLTSWSLWLPMLVLWWFKPAYEQLPLYVLSRAVFDDPPTFRETLRQARRWLPRGLLANLTWRRFAASRSYTAPVMQLEGLVRRERRARLNALHEAGNAGVWLTIAGAHFETLLYGSALVVGYVLLPEELSLRENLIGHAGFVELAELFFDFAVLSVIAPFYVAGGFSLYLHRRAQLEGWDIELVFRRLRTRTTEKRGLAASAAAWLLVGVLTLGMFGVSPPLRADETSPAHAAMKKVITEVVQHPDFGTRKKSTDWRWKSEPDKAAEKSEKPSWPALVARIGEILLWAAAAGLIVYVLYRLPEWLARLPRRARLHSNNVSPPETMFGLDIRKESLPENIPATALQLAERGEPRAALALLYRGALSVLMTRDGVPFRDGHTEGECMAQVQSSCPLSCASFFAALTRDWQRTAYGHRLPAKEAVRAHCEAWAEHFESAA